MPVKTVTFGVSTTISAALLPPSTLLINLFSCHARSCFFMLSLSTTLILLLSLLQCFVFIYKILGFIFSGVVHLPTLPVFIRSVMGQDFSQL